MPYINKTAEYIEDAAGFIIFYMELAGSKYLRGVK